jgi:ribonuclease PH
LSARNAGRATNTLRTLTIEPGAAPYAEGSCLIATGNTRVLCAASVAIGVPAWRERSGAGWVTAEYGMLPRSTHTRTSRERSGTSGRTQEIQRLIGRSLRSVTDLPALGLHTITVDCDVLQADGGTRTAGITGACVALELACRALVAEGKIAKSPVRELVAAVSVGLVDGRPVLDLDYAEDSSAQEGHPFRREQLDELMDLGMAGIRTLIAGQKRALGDGPRP